MDRRSGAPERETGGVYLAITVNFQLR